MDVFKGAAFKPPLRTSEEEYSLCSTALELDAPNRLQYSLYKRKSASRRLDQYHITQAQPGTYCSRMPS